MFVINIVSLAQLVISDMAGYKYQNCGFAYIMDNGGARCCKMEITFARSRRDINTRQTFITQPVINARAAGPERVLPPPPSRMLTINY